MGESGGSREVVVVVVLVRAYSLVLKMLAIYFGLRPFGTGRTDRAVQYGTNLQGIISERRSSVVS